MTAPVARGPGVRHRQGRRRSTALYSARSTCSRCPAAGSPTGCWAAAGRCSYGGVIIMAGHICLAVPVARHVLPRPGPDRRRHRAAQAECQRAGGQALRAGRRAPGRGLSRSTTWGSNRRIHRAADHRLAGAERQASGAARVVGISARELLALGIRRGGGGHVLRAGAVSRWAASICRRTGCVPSGRATRRRPPGVERQVRLAGSATVAVIVLVASCWWRTGAVTPRPRGDLTQLQVGADRRDGGVLRLAAAESAGGPRRSGSGWWSSPCCSWRRRCSGWRTSRPARPSTCSPSATPTTSIFGHAFPASWYQSLPPLFVIAFAAGVRLALAAAGTREPVEHRQVPDRAVAARAGVRDHDRRRVRGGDGGAG